jgi:HEAT repeat protein
LNVLKGGPEKVSREVFFATKPMLKAIPRTESLSRTGPSLAGRLAALLCFCAVGSMALRAGAEEGGGEKAAKPARGPSGKGDKAGQKGDPEYQTLREQFDKERELDPFQRLETIVKFGDIPSKQTVDFLSKLYEEEKNLAVLIAITQALGKIGTVDAVKPMVTSGLPLLSEHAGGLEELQTALSKRLDPKAEEWLIKSGLSPAVREKPEATAVIIKIIGRLRSQAKIDVLLAEVGKTKSPELQVAILEAIQPHATEKAAAIASHLARAEKPEVRVAACDVIEASGSPKYRQVFLSGLKDQYWEMRVLSIDALGKLKDKDLAKQAIQLLKDKDERVRVAMVQGLLQLGGAEAVDALVKGMAVAEGRVLDDIADALTRLTKKNLGPIHVQWEGWWAQNRDQIKDFTPLSPEELAKLKDEEGKNKATAIGPFYFGLRVMGQAAFAFDCSESMLEEYKPKDVIAAEAKAREKEKGTTSVVKKDDEAKDEGGTGKKKKKKKRSLFSRLDLAKQELLSVMKGLKDGAKVNIFRFETQVSDLAAEVAPPENPADKKALLRLDPKTREAAEKYIKASKAEGLTNLMGVLRAAFDYDEVDTIFVLSDGAPTVGITDHEELLAEVARLNRRRKIKINVISFNPQPPERKLLQALSERNYGVYVEK